MTTTAEAVCGTSGVRWTRRPQKKQKRCPAGPDNAFVIWYDRGTSRRRRASYLERSNKESSSGMFTSYAEVLVKVMPCISSFSVDGTFTPATSIKLS